MHFTMKRATVIILHIVSPQLTMQCHPKNTAPCGMTRGSATTDGQFAYFTPRSSNSVYQYQLSRDRWEELPPCPYRNSGLVMMMNRELTAVGGRGEDRDAHDNLFTLRRRKWVEEYPNGLHIPSNEHCTFISSCS